MHVVSSLVPIPIPTFSCYIETVGIGMGTTRLCTWYPCMQLGTLAWNNHPMVYSNGSPNHLKILKLWCKLVVQINFNIIATCFCKLALTPGRP